MEEKSEKNENYNSESLLGDLGGCGKFQVSLGLLITITAIPFYYLYNIDAFGVYNPGWKCVGNFSNATNSSAYSSTVMATSTTTAAMTTAMLSTGHDNPANQSNSSVEIRHGERMYLDYGQWSCKEYEACPNVEFSPDAHTILTEWNLICDKKFIISTMLSIRNAGDLCSTLIAGYIGDRFGRKLPLLCARIGILAVNLAMFFCQSWQLYAALSFMTGFFGSYGMLASIIMTEYVSPAWRVKIFSIPSFSLIAILFAVVAMFVPDWRTLRLIGVVSGTACVIPLLIFIPESLRWLSVNGTRENLEKLISKIAKANKTSLPKGEKIDIMVEKSLAEKKKPSYTVFHLFKKGYRLPTLIISFLAFSTDIIYFSFQFGIASLPGNYFTNLLLFSVCDLPANFISFFLANRYLRRPTMICTWGLCSICIFGIVAMDLLGSGGSYGITALVMVAKLFIYVGWIVLYTSEIELYPTVVRTTIYSYSWFFASMGGIAAPYLIPKDHSTFYISYLAMGILVAIGAGLLVFFPETKGIALKDRWDDDDDDDDDDDNGDYKKKNGENENDDKGNAVTTENGKTEVFTVKAGIIAVKVDENKQNGKIKENPSIQ